MCLLAGCYLTKQPQLSKATSWVRYFIIDKLFEYAQKLVHASHDAPTQTPTNMLVYMPTHMPTHMHACLPTLVYMHVYGL